MTNEAWAALVWWILAFGSFLILVITMCDEEDEDLEEDDDDREPDPNDPEYWAYKRNTRNPHERDPLW